MVYKTGFVPFCFTHAWSTGEGESVGGIYLHCTVTTTPFWNSLQAVYKWLCSLRLFPELLVLTQVMTAGLAVVPGRCSHLFRKCLQVTAGEQGDPGGTSCWVWLSKEKKKMPFSTLLKRQRKIKCSQGSGGATVFLLHLQWVRYVPSHVHSAKFPHRRTRQAGLYPVGTEQPTHARATTLSSFEKASHLIQKSRHLIHPLVKLKMPFELKPNWCFATQWKRQHRRSSLIHISVLWIQSCAFSHRGGKSYLYVRFPSWPSSPPHIHQGSTQWLSTCPDEISEECIDCIRYTEHNRFNQTHL